MKAVTKKNLNTIFPQMSAHTIISTLPLHKFPPPLAKMSGKHPSQKRNSTPPPPPLSLPQIVGIEVKHVSNATLFTTFFASTRAESVQEKS